MKKIFAILLLVLAVASCGGFDTEAKVDEVLDVHDEVMPKMGEVMNLKRKILDQAQSQTDSIAMNELRAIAKDLDEANNGMMVWMREWSKNAKPHINEQSEIELRKAFFEEEMEKVTKVKEDINGAIAAAKAALK